MHTNNILLFLPLLSLLLSHLPHTLATADPSSTSAAASAALKTLNVKHPLEYASKSLFAPLSTPQLLLRGAALRIASDLTGGTPLENLKTKLNLNPKSKPGCDTIKTLKQITAPTKENPPLKLFGKSTPFSLCPLYVGSTSRLLEGSLIGSLFLTSSTITKRSCLKAGLGPLQSSFVSGIAGGIGQCIVMIPSSNIMTNCVKNNLTFKKSVTQIYENEGLPGFWKSSGTLLIRQSTNWSSRTTLTSLFRKPLRQFGLPGEIGSGLLSGIFSSWNTPIEGLRIEMQSTGNKSYEDSWEKVKEKGIWRGVDVRMMQAGWQTVWMVVVPNVMGV
ncbi:hypothetical protein TL16_g12752 [Triparma laevis f. inornata]|uniref:Uncharacterized protein n=1 Tax=Triparma laevis f. inornata TaxID=1714386 RepID=A0A9W7BNI7_9STRA|nr:hypothetical protein TL16_g12752 [Triparma laevis f. inornata]